MVMVEGFTMDDEPLQFLDRDKASEEANRVSKETILASKEVRKGGGGWKMGKEKKKWGGGGSASSSMFAEDKLGGCFLEEREESFCVFSL
jgi:hypothetical protein